MQKTLGIALCILLFLSTTAFSETIEGIQLFSHPPKTPYKELGIIENGMSLSDTEHNITLSAMADIRATAEEMGADALIIKRIYRRPEIYKKQVNYEQDPFTFNQHLTIHLRIEVMAIKLGK